MDLAYGEEYEAFRREVQDFLATHGHEAPPPRTGIKSPEIRAWQARLIEHGYAARTIPAEYGGYGAAPDILKTVIMDEEFAKAGLSRGLGGQGISMLVPTLLEAGTEEQKKRWIPPTIRGEIIWCQGYSEPGSGSDLASLRTRAEIDGDDYVINGQKIWTSTAHIADMMFVLVRTEPDKKKHEGISYLLLPMDTPGIEVRPLVTMTGDASFNEVFFTDVRLPRDQIVGRPGDGWRVANTTLKHERGSLGDPGQAQRMLGQVVALMKSETVNGRSLMESPAYRDRLLKLQARAAATRYHGLRLLTHEIKGEDPGPARMVVKLNGTHLNNDIAEFAIDVMGELGILYEEGSYLRQNGFWEQTYMFSLGLIIGGGTSQIQKNIIAERGLGMPREPKARVPAAEVR